MHFNHIPSIPQLCQIPLSFSTYLTHFFHNPLHLIYTAHVLLVVRSPTIANILGVIALYKSCPPFPSIYQFLIPH